MNVLEKILEEIKDNAKFGNMQWETIRIEKVEKIIRSYMDDATVSKTENVHDNGWIQVSDRLPEPHKGGNII